MKEQPFRVPLQEGGSVGHWRLGPRHDRRFDVADQPMHGEMDPFFFLTKEKNFIPHEYPCRTEFAALHRGKRPLPTVPFSTDRWWFPFGSPRVDLSGFWFRPTITECWAATTIESGTIQTPRFRFATCGGAIVRINGEEVAFLSRYRRNLEEAVELDVPLRAGANMIEVWFGDLCERDARYYFELSLLKGGGLTVAVPVPVAPERVAEMEALLESMCFERPFFGEGEVTLLFPRAAAVDYAVRVTVTGDFMSTGTRPEQHALDAGTQRLVLGTAATLPADFRHFDVELRYGGFELSRTIGAEICDVAGQGAPGPNAFSRADEALRHVAAQAEPDTMRALARLALGQSGIATDAMILAGLPAIEDCHDCADFTLVPLLWCRIAYGEQLDPAVRARVDAAILGFRYWMDEPGNDVMWYFSENHALLFHAACYLAGALFPEERFVRSGRTGTVQSAIGRQRLVDWLDHFEEYEMAEWNSAPYFPIDFKGLATLFALAPDADIRRRSERAVQRLLEIVALSSHQGLLTASQGRSYEHSLRPCRTLELSAIARLFFGRGWMGSRFHSLPQLALCIRDHGLSTDERLSSLAIWQEDDALEWCFRQGEGGVAALYHHKTRNHAMGTIAGYRPGEWGYQETVLHLRLGDRPEAQIWINHPGERILSGYARPSYWGGCGMLPRVHQYRDVAVLDFALAPEQVDFTHAWLPEAEMDEVRYEGDRVFVRAGNAAALIIGSGPFETVADGPTGGCEIRLGGRNSRWLVRLSDLGRETSLEAFSARFEALAAHDLGDGTIVIADPDYGDVRCAPDGVVTGEGRRLDPKSWTHRGEAVRLPGDQPVALPSEALQATLSSDNIEATKREDRNENNAKPAHRARCLGVVRDIGLCPDRAPHDVVFGRQRRRGHSGSADALRGRES